MYPLSDNDMDRISREASEQFDAEPSTSGWDRLEKRLDKELPKEKDRRRFLWIFLLFLLLGGGLLSLQLINSGTSESPSVARTGTEATSPTVTNEPDRKDPAVAKTNEKVLPSSEIPATASTAAPVPEVKSKQVQEQKTLTSPAPLSKNTGISGYRERSVSTKKKKAISPAAPASSNDLIIQSKKPVETASDASVSDTHDKTVEVQNGTPPETSAKLIPATPVTALPATDSAKQTAATEAAPVAAAAAPKKKSNNTPKNRLALGLTAGIDWSRIRTMADERNGYNLGITVSYDISPRWSVTTGAIITRKKYTALGKDFNPPEHYWTTYVKLQSLEGYCQMIDIPLNLRYNITTGKQSKWFASTGVSSYLMSKQYYKYYYLNSTNQAMEREWTSTKKSNFWMGILNLSAGYEKQLSPHWSLQAEPFLKLPLKGVGFGKMDITSYGALFTLRYRPKF